MRKIVIAFGLIILVAGVYIFSNKLYYPPLPIESVSKKEVIEKLNDSDEKMIKLTTENEKIWYIVNDRNQLNVDETVKQFLTEKGWVFTEKMGSGLFFEKQGEKLIIETQKWTKNYSIIDMPVHFNVKE